MIWPQIIEDAMRPDDVSRILHVVEQSGREKVKGQSGINLDYLDELRPMFAHLEMAVSKMLRHRLYLRLDKSALRTQAPDRLGAIPWHADHIPLAELLTEPAPTGRITDPAAEPCCTVWLPLHRITEFTPSLEFILTSFAELVPHAIDANKYYAVADAEADRPSVAITNMPPGSGIVFGPLVLHRTYVRPWHTVTRQSLDLRFLPRKQQQ